MSNKKWNNFSKLYDYFNEEEESEEEIENYEKNYNEVLKEKKMKISKETNDDNKENNDKMIDDDNDVFYFEEKKIRDNENNDFNQIKFASFKPECFNEDYTEKKENIEKSNDLNNKHNKSEKNEIINEKIISEQNSFGTIYKNFNKSSSLNTEKIETNYQSKFNTENQINYEEYKPEYLINSEIFDELDNKTLNTKKNRNKIEWKDGKVLVKKNVNQLKLYMKKNIKMNNKSKTKSKDNKKGNNIKKKRELMLYEDALKKKKKIENINRNTISEYKLNSTRPKINKVSYRISLKYSDKKIESILNKYSNELNIIDIALILTDLKIFRKLLQNINANKLKNINNFEEFKNIISIAIKENEIRKIKELDFLEQIWNLIYTKNEKNQNFVKNDILEGFLKILFSSTGNISDILNILEQYIKAASFSQILDKLNIKKCIKNFFELKENIIAYKNINDFNDEKYEKIIKEKYKDLTFAPNTTKNESYNNVLTQRKKNFNFNTLYDRFVEKEKNKQNNLNKLKKEKLKKEMKEIKSKPTISKYSFNNFYQDEDQKEEIHEKLYKMGDYLRNKKQKIIEEKERKDKEKLEQEFKTYKLNYNSRKNRKRMAKSFDNKEKPKGFDEYIIRNRKEILNKKKLKEKLEKIPCGENYEKMRKRTITPFNITDMRKKNKIKKEDDDEYSFTMKIKIANGQMRNLKINIKSDPFKVANEFCKIYSIRDGMKNKLINNIINCQKSYLEQLNIQI